MSADDGCDLQSIGLGGNGITAKGMKDISRALWNNTRLESVGLGGNISKSIHSMREGERPSEIFHSQGEDSGNGSLMRLAPIPIFFATPLEVSFTSNLSLLVIDGLIV